MPQSFAALGLERQRIKFFLCPIRVTTASLPSECFLIVFLIFRWFNPRVFLERCHAFQGHLYLSVRYTNVYVLSIR